MLQRQPVFVAYMIALMLLVGCQSSGDVIAPIEAAGSDRAAVEAPRPSAPPPKTVKKSSVDLPSWARGKSRQRIVRFVNAVTNPQHRLYIPAAERIATFDLDGTLWVERPRYPLMEFIIEHLQRQTIAEPQLRGQQPWKAIWEQDLDYFQRVDSAALYRTLLKTHSGKSLKNYRNDVEAFLKSRQHPRFKKPYTQLAYRPMVELISYLQRSAFKVYIVSGSEATFVRSFAGEVFGIPPEQVIGSAVLLDWDSRRNRLVRQGAFVTPVNDRRGKPVNIQRHIGRRPIIAVGNANGDLDMLRYAKRRKGPSLAVVIHHDDDRREFAYEEGAGELLATAAQQQWLTVSMKRDFRKLF